MMSHEELLTALQPEIWAKCEEIKARKREKRLKIMFLCFAGLFLVFPSLLVLAGFSVIASILAVSTFGIVMLIINMPNLILVYERGFKYEYRQE